MKNLILLLLLFVCFTSSGQLGMRIKQLKRNADSLYYAGNYFEAVKYYLIIANNADFPLRKAHGFYGAACCLSLQGKRDSAIECLKSALKNGFNDKKHILVDTDLENIHNSKQWKTIVNNIKDQKTLNSNPLDANFHTEDINHFWVAYKMASKDTAHFKSIFTNLYFKNCSIGLNDYMGSKGGQIEDFIAFIKSAPKFYHGIQNLTLQINRLKPIFSASFQKFKKLYNQALFPDVYFLIGAFNAGGTVSSNGLLLGVDQECKNKYIPLNELSFQKQAAMDDFTVLPFTVAHELIHFQQAGMKRDTTTLSYVIEEGMADFMAELTGQSTANIVLYKWAKGKEKMIWERFKNDMYLNRYYNWISNHSTSSPDNLPDQGYWVGYQICKAYFDNASDKQKAIYDMLHLADYKRFLQESKFDGIPKS